MNIANAVRQRDTPPISVDFTDHLRRLVTANTTLQSCTAECFLATSEWGDMESDADFPDAGAASRVEATAAVLSPYAAVTFGGGSGDGPVEGATYVVQFNGLTTDGKKCTAQVVVPVRKTV